VLKFLVVYFQIRAVMLHLMMFLLWMIATHSI
jgi:hypothetical protein